MRYKFYLLYKDMPQNSTVGPSRVSGEARRGLVRSSFITREEYWSFYPEPLWKSHGMIAVSYLNEFSGGTFLVP
jgi:hypothetical protein